MDLPELKKKTVQELRKMAEELGIEKTSGLKKHDLALKILVALSEQNGHRYGYGILEIRAGSPTEGERALLVAAARADHQ